MHRCSPGFRQPLALASRPILVVVVAWSVAVGAWAQTEESPRNHEDRAGEGSSGGDERPAAESELRNTLRWKTASEVDNFGFDVYRSDSEDGPFERLTEQPIPGAGTTDEPQRYVFVDDTIEAGQEYWYYVESISMMGVRERFTPVFRAAAKGSDSVHEGEPGEAAGDDGSGTTEDQDGDRPSDCG